MWMLCIKRYYALSAQIDGKLNWLNEQDEKIICQMECPATVTNFAFGFLSADKFQRLEIVGYLFFIFWLFLFIYLFIYYVFFSSLLSW